MLDKRFSFGDLAEEAKKDTFGDVNITDQGDQFLIKAKLPGAHVDDINVNYDHGILTISGFKETTREIKDDKTGTHTKEVYIGRFSRSLPVGDVEFEGIKADMSDDILIVTVRKT